MRFTVVDDAGTVSFVGPGHAMKMLAAGCARGAADFWALLDALGRYDEEFARAVADGVRVFDEHNTPDDHAEVARRLATSEPSERSPFRVLDEVTRLRSLEPTGAGVVVYNLAARRIVQVQNSYAELERRGRGRIREGGRPGRRLYHYALPDAWTILP